MGKERNVPWEEILRRRKEGETARALAEDGVQECIVIAQDITRYGVDLYGERRLPELLRELCRLPFHWVRLHYLYPDNLSDELIDTIAGEAKICNYLDIPIQHCNDTVLKAMRRRETKAGLEELLRQKREASAPAAAKAEVKAPAKEPCTAGIPGIEVMDIEAAVQVLWAKDIYAESAMGCTGPLVLVSDANEERAKTLLREAGYIG